MLPEGTYLARGTTISFGDSKKGTPCANVVFVIESKGPQEGVNIEWPGWLSEGAKARTVEALGYCGYDGENEKTISTNQVQLVIEHEDYTNESGKTFTNAKVKWVNDPARGGAMISTEDAGKSAAIKADLRGLMMAQKQAKGTPAATPVQQANGPAVKF